MGEARSQVAFWLLKVGAAFLALGAAQAQIVTDGSLGPVVDFGSGDATIPGDVGTAAGGSLFHSFESFQINEGATVVFTAEGVFDHVISRVTGGDATALNGALRSEIAGADFWLLNPNGVAVGDAASFDVPVGLHLGAADHVLLADGTRFSATANGSTLSMAPAEAFGFVGEGGPISIGRTDIITNPGEAITVAGGSVDLLVPLLLAPSGDLTIIAQSGDLTSLGAGISIADRGGLGGGSIRIEAGNIVFENTGVFSVGGSDTEATGPILIEARGDIDVIFSTIFTDAEVGRGAGVTLRGRDITLDDFAFIGTEAFRQADGGDILIEARNLSLVRAGRIETASRPDFFVGEGDAGDITIRADETVTLNGGLIIFDETTFSGISSTSELGSLGDAGDITVEANAILISDSARIDQFVDGGNEFVEGGRGDGGAVQLIARERIELAREAEIALFAGPLAVETNGSLTLQAPEIALLSGAQITSTLSNDTTAFNVPAIAQGGAIRIEGGSILFDGDTDFIPLATGVFTTNTTNDTAPIGTVGTNSPIFLSGESVVLRNGGRIEAGTTSFGEASTVTVDLTGDFLADGAGGFENVGIYTLAFGQSEGDAGDVVIRARDLSLFNGAQIGTTTRAFGDGGDVTLDLTGDLDIRGQSPGTFFSGVFAGSEISRGDFGFPFGSGGQVSISARNVTLSDGGFIGASTANASQPGGVDIAASERIEVGVSPSGEQTDGPSGEFVSAISASSFGGAAAGTVRLSANRVVVGGDGAVTTNAAQASGGDIVINSTAPVDVIGGTVATSVLGGEGGGGDVAITAPGLLVLDGRIQANAVMGDGGNIDIVVDALLVSVDGVIEASSELGVDGTIATSAPAADIAGDVAPLGSRLAGATVTLGLCANARDAEASRLTPKPPAVRPDRRRLLIPLAAPAQGAGRSAGPVMAALCVRSVHGADEEEG